MNIIGYILTRNGKSNHLPNILEHLEDFYDYLVVSVDESSDDGTEEWLRDHDVVDDVITHDAEWPEQEPEVRRAAYDKAKNESPDADILVALDDDEMLPEKKATKEFFEKMIEEDVNFGASGTFHLWKDNYYRVDAAWNPKQSPHVISENLNLEHSGEWADNGPHCGRFPVKNAADANMTGIFPLVHFGWLLPLDEQNEKLQRKLDNDKRDWEDLNKTQKIHYESFSNEATLKELPKKWIEYYECDRNV